MVVSIEGAVSPGGLLQSIYKACAAVMIGAAIIGLGVGIGCLAIGFFLNAASSVLTILLGILWKVATLMVVVAGGYLGLCYLRTLARDD